LKGIIVIGLKKGGLLHVKNIHDKICNHSDDCVYICEVNMIKPMQVIKGNLETTATDLQERLDSSVASGYSEPEYQAELSEWIDTLSKTVMEMENHIEQVKKEANV
jgi:hypothetical protein